MTPTLSGSAAVAGSTVTRRSIAGKRVDGTIVLTFMERECRRPEVKCSGNETRRGRKEQRPPGPPLSENRICRHANAVCSVKRMRTSGRAGPKCLGFDLTDVDNSIDSD